MLFIYTPRSREGGTKQHENNMKTARGHQNPINMEQDTKMAMVSILIFHERG
jgi:hypothetical protein